MNPVGDMGTGRMEDQIGIFTAGDGSILDYVARERLPYLPQIGDEFTWTSEGGSQMDGTVTGRWVTAMRGAKETVGIIVKVKSVWTEEDRKKSELASRRMKE